MPRYEITLVLRGQTHKKGNNEYQHTTRINADDCTSARRKVIADAQGCGHIVSEVLSVVETSNKPR